MTTVTPHERVRALLEGRVLDRPPVCFWRHFDVDAHPDRLAAATLEFFVERHDLDVVKIMPDLGRPGPLGSVTRREQWSHLADLLEPDDWRRAHLRCLERVRAGLRDDRPVIMTLFSPMGTAAHLAPGLDALLADLARWPDEVADGLAVLADVIAATARAVVDAGADGVFLGMQGCGIADVADDVHRAAVVPAEAAALTAVPESLLRVAHLHADPPLRWEMVASLGANVVSFSETEQGPTLDRVRDDHGLAVMGGWDEHGALSCGHPDDVVREGCASLERTHGERHLLAPGCSLLATHDDLLDAARRTPQHWSEGRCR